MSNAERPNFLFLFPDQHRPDWVPWNVELPLRMPTLRRIADAGVRFSKAVTPSPLCAPARACLASGRTYERCGVPNNNLDYPLDQATYYQRLRDSGYRVAGVGKFDLRKATMDWGLAGDRDIHTWGFTEGVDNEGKMDALASWLGQGGTRRVGGEPGKVGPRGPYMAFLQSRGLAETHIEDFKGRRGAHGHHATHPTPLPPDAYCDTWIAENGLRFLRGFPSDTPWHLVVNFNGPHSPMDVTEEMHARWQGVEFPSPATESPLTAEERKSHNAVRQNYAAMLENIDTQIARLLAVVEERGELERTVIVYSSDHGEMLGDHARWGKSTAYQPSAGVPLAIAGPGFQRSVASDALVSTHDLTATFLELAGAEPLPEMDSISLVPLLRGETSTHREHVRSGLDEWRMAWDGRLKLVQTTLDSGETANRLYDLTTDPTEMHDAAAERPDDVRRLAPLLAVDV